MCLWQHRPPQVLGPSRRASLVPMDPTLRPGTITITYSLRQAIGETGLSKLKPGTKQNRLVSVWRSPVQLEVRTVATGTCPSVAKYYEDKTFTHIHGLKCNCKMHRANTYLQQTGQRTAARGEGAWKQQKLRREQKQQDKEK